MLYSSAEFICLTLGLIVPNFPFYQRLRRILYGVQELTAKEKSKQAKLDKFMKKQEKIKEHEKDKETAVADPGKTSKEVCVIFVIYFMFISIPLR